MNVLTFSFPEFSLEDESTAESVRHGDCVLIGMVAEYRHWEFGDD